MPLINTSKYCAKKWHSLPYPLKSFTYSGNFYSLVGEFMMLRVAS